MMLVYIIFPFDISDQDFNETLSQHTDHYKEYMMTIRFIQNLNFEHDFFKCELDKTCQLQMRNLKIMLKSNVGKNIIFQVQLCRQSDDGLHKELVSFIAKVSRSSLPGIPLLFKRERLFYHMITRYNNELEYLPRYYPELELENLRGRPSAVLLLQDLTLPIQGYKETIDILDEDQLKLCMTSLAQFYVDMMQLKLIKGELYRNFYYILHRRTEHNHKCYKIRQVLKQMDKIDLDCNLFEKVKKKYKKYINFALHRDDDKFLTIIHGYFVGSKVMFKYQDNKPCAIKIINWQTVRYDSPSFDFGSILITNLPAETRTDESKLEAFYRNMLQFYLDNVIKIYSDITRENLEKHIIGKLLFSYLNHYDVIKENCIHQTILKTFDKLGSLD